MIDKKLVSQLKQKRVRIVVSDPDTVILKNVPVHADCFNKPHTNVLFKRVDDGMPFVVFVDEDLQYSGSDENLTHLFAKGQEQNGWRALFVESAPPGSFQQAVERTLSALGFEGNEPVLEPGCIRRDSETGKLLDRFGMNLSSIIQESEIPHTVGRIEQIVEAASCILRWGQTRMPLISGFSGTGKSNLLLGIARMIFRHRPSLQIISVDLGRLLSGTLFESERENLLSLLLQEVKSQPDKVIALENLSLCLIEVPHGPLLLSAALDSGVQLIGTTLNSCQSLFEKEPFRRHLHFISLPESTIPETIEILSVLCPELSAHHQVEIDPACIGVCAHAAQPLPGYMPAKAITLLDAAVARASLSDAKVLGVDDIYFAAAHPGSLSLSSSSPSN